MTEAGASRRAGTQVVHRRDPDTAVSRAASYDAWTCGALRVVRNVRARPLLRHRVEDASAELLLVVVHEGDLWCRQRDNDVDAGPGSIVSLLLTEPFVLRTTAGSRVTALQIPRSVLEERGIETNRFAALAWEETVHLGPLTGLLNKVATEVVTGTAAWYVERAILELVTGILSMYQEMLALGDSSEDHLRQRIINVIRTACTDPQVDVAWIAARLGMSRRYAHRLFEGMDVSIASLLRSRRLEHAENLLRTGPPDLPIARVATSSGFRSADTFTRAFRARHAVAPAEYRARLYD